jgi:hypothetical protein
MSGPAELAALCTDYDITEASGKVSRAEHDIANLLIRRLAFAGCYIKKLSLAENYTFV